MSGQGNLKGQGWMHAGRIAAGVWGGGLVGQGGGGGLGGWNGWGRGGQAKGGTGGGGRAR